MVEDYMRMTLICKAGRALVRVKAEEVLFAVAQFWPRRASRNRTPLLEADCVLSLDRLFTGTERESTQSQFVLGRNAPPEQDSALPMQLTYFVTDATVRSCLFIESTSLFTWETGLGW
jgi:hypothetical protein